MKKIATSVLAMTLLTASLAMASGPGPFYARGGYYDGGWSADAGNLMTLSAGVWSRSVPSPMAAGYYEGKVAVGDWSESYPASNMPVWISGPGDIVTWTFDTNVYLDGWLPATDIAMNDHAIPAGTTFEVIGAAPETGGWASGVAATLVGDIWSVTINIAAPASYDVKFRKTGDWSLNVGTDGVGTNANNANYTTTVPFQDVQFQFNQRTGRIRVTVDQPTPTRAQTWGKLKQLYR
jgi:hypothetical protein